MSEKEIRSTLQIAQKLVNRLPKEMDDELKRLIARAEKGQDTTVEIIDLLSPHDNIRQWIREQINLQSGQKGTTRGYGTLAGDPSVSASRRWICPKTGCAESLPVIQEDEDAPTCRVDGVVMVRVERGKDKPSC
jgi:hypothetical protein